MMAPSTTLISCFQLETVQLATGFPARRYASNMVALYVCFVFVPVPVPLPLAPSPSP